MLFVVVRIPKGKGLLEGLQLRSWARIHAPYLVVLHYWDDSMAHDRLLRVDCPKMHYDLGEARKHSWGTLRSAIVRKRIGVIQEVQRSGETRTGMHSLISTLVEVEIAAGG